MSNRANGAETRNCMMHETPQLPGQAVGAYPAYSNLGRTNVIFVLVILLAASLTLIGGRSEWLSDRIMEQRTANRVAIQESDTVTKYDVSLGCNPIIGVDYCTAEIATTYNFTETADDQRISLLVSDFTGDLSISLNGGIIFQTTGLGDMLRLSPMHPIMIDLPSESLRSGRNDLAIQLISSSALGGYLSTMFIGDHVTVAKYFEQSRFWFEIVPIFFGGALLLISLLALFIGLRHREPAFLLCAMVCLTFSASSLYDLLPIETPHEWLQSIRALRLVSGAFLGAFIFSVSGLRYPISLRAISLYVAVFIGIWLVVTSNFQVFIMAKVAWIVSILLVIHAVFALTASGKLRDGTTPRVLLAVAIIGVLIMSVSMISSFSMPVGNGPPLRGYGAAAFMLAMSIELVNRFSDKTARLEASNDEMRQAIFATTRSLQQSHARAEAQRQSLLIQAERQRLMGDLHDGLAGSLISIQALSKDADPASMPKVHDLANHALLDLRLVVESLDTFEGDLAAAIAAFRERIAPQYSGGRFRLHWQTATAPTFHHLSPEVSLTIFRILQEAIANACRHGQARNVWIGARTLKGAPDTVLITVRDDGMPQKPVIPGFGMLNMRRRARDIGGILRFRFSNKGSIVSLRLSVLGPTPSQTKSV
jgi:signal transduction histidine kinase